MKSPTHNPPAFPSVPTDAMWDDGSVIEHGMTLLDAYALQVISGNIHIADHPTVVFDIAEALLAERNKRLFQPQTKTKDKQNDNPRERTGTTLPTTEA